MIIMNIFGVVGFETNDNGLNFQTDPDPKRESVSLDRLFKFWEPLSNFGTAEARHFKFGLVYRLTMASVILWMIN